MKKTLLSILGSAITIMFVGCTSEVPSAEKISMISSAIGASAGLVYKARGVSEGVNTTVMTIIDAVETMTPGTNTTFVSLWESKTDEITKKLVSENKLKENDVPTVKICMKIASTGIDFLFEKYPKAKEYDNLVKISISKFISGFKSTSGASSVAMASEKLDQEATDIVELATTKMKSVSLSAK